MRFVALFLLSALLSHPAFAEGSKELNANGGNRPFINCGTTYNVSFPFTSYGTVKVYVNVGERIFLGSSAQGIGSGTINLRAPNGVNYSSGTSTTTGRISNRTQEVNGPNVGSVTTGYVPYIVTVGAGQAGIWEIDFIPPSPTNTTSPSPILASGSWSQPSTAFLAAFDVSVRNAGNTAFIPGRLFTTNFVANMGNISSTFRAIFNVLTRDGYIYTVNNNGQAGFGFTFFVNNKGFRDANGAPLYKSIDDITTADVQDPRSEDTESDVTHKIFFNSPASDLPTSGATRSGTDWLLITPTPAVVSNYTFTGVEGSANVAGTNPAGGNIGFTASQNGNFLIRIDLNNNGVYTDAVDRSITGSATAGTNTVYWNGLNGLGQPTATTISNINVQVVLYAGEVHFPFIDVENNPNGIIITRTNGSGANDVVFWDDSDVPVSGIPSNPVVNTTGISSTTNGHKWGSTSYSATDFGNENGLDTWAYITSTPLTGTTNVVLREADLETVFSSSNLTAACVGASIIDTVRIRNNGPSNVTGASVRITFPAELTGVTVTSAVTSGTASLTSSSTTTTQYSAVVNMNNAAVMTFIVRGTVSSFPSSSNITFNASIMRPPDVTDPDATNPDPAPPTDPQNECDAAPSGVGCNNIKVNTITISNTPTTATIVGDAAPTYCAVTSATLTGNTASVGTVTWTKISGPGTQTFTSPNSASTTVNGLQTGTYVFRYTISSGACTPSTADVTLTVQAALSNNVITAPLTVSYCGSGDPSVITGSTPSGGSGTYTYQWQSSLNNSTWTDISGATSASYDPPALTTTTYFRRTVTSGACTTPSNSNVVQVTIIPSVTNNTITAPATTTFCTSGDPANIVGTTPTGGSGIYAIQWQQSSDSTNWSDILGAIGTSYDPPLTSTTTYYRRAITSATCLTPVLSNVVKVTVQPTLTSGSIATDQVLCGAGDPALLTAAAPTGGTGTYTYQWQSSTTSSSAGFTDIASATAATYDPPVITTTTYYRRIVRSGVCPDATSNVVTITINPSLTAGSIGSNQTFCASGDPNVFSQLTAATGGNGVYTYQWQSSTTSATAGFTNISGATAPTYDEGTISTTTYYRRITRSDGCTDAISNVVTVTIQAGIGNNTISADQTICTGSTPAALAGAPATGGSGTFTYLWQSSTNGTTFVAAAGTNNGQNYSPGALTQSTIFRRVVTSGACATGINSNIVQITVRPTTSVANAGTDQGPLTTSTTQLQGNNPTQGIGAWTQLTGPGPATINNASLYNTTVSNLVPGAYIFRWTITNDPCPSSSANVTIRVNQPPFALNDSITTNEDQPININVTANDFDSDGSVNVSSIVIASQPKFGTVAVNANGTVLYNPIANYNGPDDFTYTIRDNLGATSNAATVKLTVNSVNDIPVAADDYINVSENTTITLPAPGVLANDVDADKEQLTAVLILPVKHGTAQLNADGSLTYTPTRFFFGLDSLRYRVCDAANTCDTATVYFNVGNVNDKPVANADTYNMLEDGKLTTTVSVLANDTDADNDPLTATLLTQPAHGSIIFQSNGQFIYTPAANYNGTETFTYTACDAGGLCDTGTVTINIAPVNDAPNAVNDAYNTAEDVPLVITAPGVLQNDVDVDGQPLTVALVTAPTNGTIVLNANGSFTYTPNRDFNGLDVITYRVCDNGTPSLCDTATISITVTPVNDTVVIANETYTLNEDNALNVVSPGVLANDVDPDGDAITAALVTGPKHGTLTLRPNGSFNYLPDANYNGVDSFVYRVCDNSGACRLGTTTLNITAVNDKPVAGNDAFSVDEDQVLNVPAGALTTNDIDVDGNPLTTTLVTGPTNGTITVRPNGSFTYTPNANYNGTDVFTYRVCDNGTPSLCDTATVTITVNAVNDAPVAVNDSYSLNEDQPLTIANPGVLANDTDIDGDVLTVNVITSPAHGKLTANAAGGFTYTPGRNYNGTDSYTYQACDNAGLCSNIATVTFTIAPVNDPPSTSPVSYAVDEDNTLNVGAPGVLFNSSDVDGDPLTATLVQGPANGTLTLNSNGSFTFVPAANFNGNDFFTYNVCDPQGACILDSAFIRINAVNDAPVAYNDVYTVAEDNTLTIAAPGVLSNDTDTENDALTASLLIRPIHGTLTLNATGSFSYVPNANYNGVDSFSYRLCDAGGLCDTAVVVINITPENDAPVAGNDNYSIDEDKPLVITSPGVLFNDFDIDGDPIFSSIFIQPANGTVTMSSNGSFTYIPNPNFNGVDTFVYRVCDNDTPQLCSNGTVTVVVRPVNDAPSATNDAYTTAEDTPLTVAAPGVLANDTDVDGDPITASIVRQPLNGTVTLNANGAFTYTPSNNFNGTDTLWYRVCDNATPSACSNAFAVFTVTPVNDAPIPKEDNYTTAEDQTLTIVAPAGVLFNDSDPENDPLTATVVINPVNGTVILNSNGTFSYTPNANYNGIDSFTYRACDNSLACADAIVHIVVTPVNDIPVATDDNYTLAEDTPLTVAAPGVLSNDVDADDDPLTVVIVTNPAHGTVTLNPSGGFTYTPVKDYNGTDVFSYKVCDGSNACDTAFVNLTITAVNDTPVIVPDVYNIPPLLPFAGNQSTGNYFTKNDYDPDGDPITPTPMFTTDINGNSLLLSNDGFFQFTSAPGFLGAATFTYTACDPGGLCGSATVTFNVGAVNVPPVAVTDSFTVDEDDILRVQSPGRNILTNDADPNGGSIYVSGVATQPLHGTVTVSTDGSFTYVPEANYNGLDSFYVNVCDPQGLCANPNNKVIITINPVNDRPDAENDSYSGAEDTPLTGNVQDNDADADNDALTSTLIDAVGGTVVLNANGTFTFTPNLNFNGNATFRYSLCDNGVPSLCDTALVNLYFEPVNDTPSAINDLYNMAKNTVLVVDANNSVLQNDQTYDGDALSVSVDTLPRNGTLQFNSNGTFRYIPNTGFYGVDSFFYKVCDPFNACSGAKVTINVVGSNEVPVAVDDVASTSEDSTVTGNVLTNDSDPDPTNTLSATLVTIPANGSVIVNANGSYTYTPNPNFNGTDVFSYQVCDNGVPSLCDTGNVVITVNPVNDPPVATADDYSTLEDNTLNIPVAQGVLVNDTDIDNEPLSATVVTTTTNGILQFNSNGSFRYIPNRYYNGVDSFTYRACDVAGTCSTAIARIHITPVNNAPIAVDDIFVRTEDTVITFPPIVILINDSDPDGDSLSGRPIGNLQHGTYVSNPNGTYTYTPARDYFGVDSIMYQVCDPYGLCDTGLIKVILLPVNDPPLGGVDNYTVLSDSTLIVSSPGVLANDKDIDDTNLSATLVTGPTKGSLQLNSDGSFTYVPNQYFYGLDSATYNVCDTSNACSLTKIYFTVVGSNHPPTAITDNYTTAEDSTYSVEGSTGVLANDFDVDGEGLTASLAVAPNNGSVVVNPNGGFTYTPNPNFFGKDVFTYQVCDNNGTPLCVIGTVNITVQPRPDQPIAQPDTYTVKEDSVINVPGPGVLVNDNNVDNDQLTATLLTPPTKGTFSFNADGSFTYRPPLYTRSIDSFTYRVCNLSGLCDSSKVYLNVLPVNHAPVGVDDVFTIPEDTVITFNPNIALVNDIDVDGDSLVGTPISLLRHGTYVINGNGTITYTPDRDYNGVDSVQYKVCDPFGLCDTAYVKLIILPVNDAPVACDKQYATPEDEPYTVLAPGILTCDSDVDGDVLNGYILVQPKNGVLNVRSDNSFTYTPHPNFFGQDTTWYVVYDPSGARDTGTIIFTVIDVNDAPIANDNTVAVAKDSTANGNVLLNASDVDKDALTATVLVGATHGNLNLNPNGTFTYTPNAGYMGIDTVLYTVCDNGKPVLCDTAKLTLIVFKVNFPPIANDDTLNIAPNVQGTGNVVTNDNVPNGDTLTAVVLSTTANGTITMQPNGSYTYLPPANFLGVDTIRYQVCDNDSPALCDTATLIVNVVSTNLPPLAIDNLETCGAGIPITGNVLANDYEPNPGDTLTATLLTFPTKGSITLSANGDYTYVANITESGVDTVYIKVCDNGVPSLCDTSRFLLYISAYNNPPVTADDILTVVQGNTIGANIFRNDTDDTYPLRPTVIKLPINTYSLDSAGNFTYTAPVNFLGNDTLIYRVCDAGYPSKCDTAMVIIRVVIPNVAPVAVNDQASIVVGNTATGNVLINDTDANNDVLVASIIKSTTKGNIILSADGSYNYTPNGISLGADTLIYRVCDTALCDTGLLILQVLSNNRAPIAVNDAASAVDGVPTIGNVLLNDSDPDDNALVANLLRNVQHGSLAFNADGSFTYTANGNYTGLDTLVYSVCDNGLPSLCDTAVLVITVSRPPNGKPIANNDQVSLLEGGNASGNVLSNDIDPEGDPLTASIISNANHGVFTLNPNGSFTYAPNAGFFGSDSVMYRACDNSTPPLCDTALLVFAVQQGNRKPVAQDDIASAIAGIALNGNVVINDSDPDGNAITAYLLNTVQHGVLTFSESGSYTYTPNANFAGLDSFVYRICDDGKPSLCDTAVARFTVSLPSDKPVANNDLVTLNTGGTATGNVLSNDIDPQGRLLTVVVAKPAQHGAFTLNSNGTFTYTPGPSYAGQDTVIYSVCTNEFPPMCDSALVIFTIVQGNRAPMAIDDSKTAVAGVTVTGNVLANDSDPDGDGVVAGVVKGLSNGQFNFNTDGTYTYTPVLNFIGNDTLIYQVCDNGKPSRCDTAMLVITVGQGNRAPVGNDEVVNAVAGLSVTGNVLSNDTDPDGNTLSASMIRNITHGTFNLNEAGSFTYTPAANYVGNDTLVYRLCDNGIPSLCDSATLIFIVSAPQGAPIANNDHFQVASNGSTSGNVLSNDLSTNGGSLTASIVKNASHGAFALNADGTFTYSPATGFVGIDSIAYRACDNATPPQCDTAYLIVTVIQGNRAPVIVGESVTTISGIPVVGNVLANDTDPDGNVLTATQTANVKYGIIAFNSDGSYTYTSTPGYVGNDTLHYRVCDNGVPPLCGDASLIITVLAPADKPVANDDVVKMNSGSSVSGNVLTNDIDPVGGTLVASTITGASNGTFALNADGSYTYTPNTGYAGSDTVRYRACNNATPPACDTALLIFNVIQGNRAPVAVNDAQAALAGIPVSGNVLTNDSDPDGNLLIASVQQNVQHGRLVLNGDGSYTYTPGAGFVGLDSLVYRVCDNGIPSQCATASLVFTVTIANRAPVVVNDNVSLVSGGTANGNVLNNDSDPDGDPLTVSIVKDASNGVVVLNTDGTFTYTPNVGFVGIDTVIYQACDNRVPPACSQGFIIFNVAQGNRPPLAIDDVVNAIDGIPVIGNVLSNDTDPDGNALVATLLRNVQHGFLAFNADGSYTYTADGGYAGTDTVVYSVCDNGTPTLCDTAMLIFTVTNLNGKPLANDDRISLFSGNSASGNVLANDTDPEGDPLSASIVKNAGNGVFALNANGSFTYTPNVGFVGIDTVIYRACDNSLPPLCDTALLIFTIDQGNRAPIANNDAATAVAGIELNGNVMSNDSDPDGNLIQATLITNVKNGTLTFNLNGAYTYTPNATFGGQDTLVYMICDIGQPALCDTAIAVFTVILPAEKPVANDDNVSLDAGGAASGNVLSNDIDPRSRPLTTSIVKPAANGTFNLNADGSFTYTPNAGFFGNDTVIYRACNNATPPMCDSALLIFNVIQGNRAPVAVDDSKTAVAGVTVTGNVLANDSDPDGNAVVAGVVKNVSHGACSFNSDGTYTYTADLSYIGTDTLVYSVCDNGTPSLCDTAILVITVGQGNRAPIANNENLGAIAGVAVTGNVLANDTDPDGNALTASVVKNITHGTMVLGAGGSFNYTPAANYVGNDTLVYQVCDNGVPSLCDTATLIFTVNAPQAAPIANSDNVQSTPGIPTTGNVLTNDIATNGGSLTASVVTPAAHGTFNLNPDGSFTYTPTPGYVGLDSIAYRACSNETPPQCDTAYVIITVVQGNRAPVVFNESVGTIRDIPVSGNVLANDSDPDGNVLTATQTSNVKHGVIAFNADGSYTYTPSAGYVGNDTMTYRVCDNGVPSLCSDASLIITVVAPAGKPVANEDVVQLNVGGSASGNVLSNDIDPDGGSLTASIISNASHGICSLNADGSFTYTPAAGFLGPDTVRYRACNNATPPACDTAYLIFQVLQGNRAPLAIEDYLDAFAGIPVNGNVLANDSDPDGNLLIASIEQNVKHGVLVLNGNGTFTYTANAGFTGMDTLVYRVCDNGIPSMCTTSSLFITVTIPNAVPIAVNDMVAATAGTAVTGNVLTNDSDPDGQPLTASTVRGVQHGTIVLNADGSFTYTANAGYAGSDTLIYRACDNGTPSLCDTAYLVFNVTIGNMAPVAVNDVQAATAGSPATGNVLSNDTDPDGQPLTASTVRGVQHGTIVLNADGSFTYTANAGYAGSDTLIYRACDNGTPSLCDTAYLVFNVGIGNQAPVAVNDVQAATAGTATTGNVLANDADPDGQPLTASTVRGVQHGTIVLNADGSFTYTANAGYAGSDTLIYRACDNGTPSLCDTAYLVFNVTIGNRAPVAVNDVQAGPAGVAITGNVITNDSDPDGQPLTASVVRNVQNGIITVNADGTFSYTANTNFNGSDTLSYQVCDNGTPSLCDTAYLVFNISTGNHPPTANNDRVTTKANTTVTGNVLDNDTDPDRDNLTVSVISNVQHGTITFPANGSFSYTPSLNFTGLDSLVYRVCDNGTPNLCDTAVLYINVVANEKPIAGDDIFSGLEGTTVTGDALQNDIDPDGSSLTPSVVSGPRNGTFSFTLGGNFTYTPNTGFTGRDTITYRVCDNGTPSLCDTATIIINMIRGNRAPVAVDEFVNANAGEQIRGNVLSNDSDPDGNSLLASLVRGTLHGTFTLNDDGSYTYTPDANFQGLDTLFYRICDNATPQACANARLIIDVRIGLKPVIGIAKAVASSKLENDGTSTISLTFTVRNMGNVPITNVQVEDNLSNVFPAPLTYRIRSISASGNLIANASYNGAANINLLSTGSTLAVGALDSITLSFNVTPHGTYGTYNNVATLVGFFNNQRITDLSTDGRNVDPNNDGTPSEQTPTPIVVAPRDIYTPTAFTPNGDGKNDRLIFGGLDRYPNSRLTIYNRWGNQVYHNKNYDNSWTAEKLLQGTYYYILEINAPEGKRVLTGWIELMR
ncbi:gliding motility-associated-like protein [Chitinophaga skermanii]|uniref:Gliding motility-associated-like protein n=2 Tax=Chitinophaga skermanii TaxID=331697 RepID=A0A327PZR9_9BACT|nr:gliding motility-associated-like protein [Chitinophaga skermanii]